MIRWSTSSSFPCGPLRKVLILLYHDPVLLCAEKNITVLLLELKSFPFRWLSSLMEKVSLHFFTQIFKVRRCVWKGASHFSCHLQLWTLLGFNADRSVGSSFTQIWACKGGTSSSPHAKKYAVFAVYQTSFSYSTRHFVFALLQIHIWQMFVFLS